MGKKYIIFFTVLVVVLVGGYLFSNKSQRRPDNVACTMDAIMCPDGSYVGRTAPLCEFAPCPAPTRDEKNTSYNIDGEIFHLTDGKAEKSIGKNPSVKINVEYFGNEAVGDFNGDGLTDKAFYLTQNSGGSGTFFYLAVALKQGTGYIGTNAVLLGDRIAPQNINFEGGRIIANFADRKAGEPMTAKPSVGVSYYFKVINNSLFEVK